MTRPKWFLSLLTGFLMASGALLAQTQAVVLNVGPAANAGVVGFTLVAPDNSMLNVQTVASSGDSAAIIATRIVAAVAASGGTTWSAQANSGAVTFAYNPGTGYTPVTKVTSLINTAGAVMSLAVQGAGTTSLAFNAGASGGGQSSLTLTVSGFAFPYTVQLYGQSASAIVDGIQTYLSNAGISYYRSASNKIDVYVGPAQSVSVVTNNPGLQGKVVLSSVATAACGRGGTDK